RRIIFSSNLHDPQRRTFHLFLIGDDGQGLEQVTAEGGFNSFPMFSPDGSKLVWVSDRGTKEEGEFNIFLADWAPCSRGRGWASSWQPWPCSPRSAPRSPTWTCHTPPASAPSILTISSLAST